MNDYNEYNQPILDPRFFNSGKTYSRFMKINEAQEALDGIKDLTSHQYDSFWLGWFWDDDNNDTKTF